MPDAVIVDAVRTPIGRAAKGSLKDVRADDLAAIPLRALVERNPGPIPNTMWGAPKDLEGYSYDLDKATASMLDVHEKGRAVVASGTREQSEMHVFRLHEHGLWATLEHDE